MATSIVYAALSKVFQPDHDEFSILGAERTNTVGPICQVEILYFMRSCYRNDLNS